MSKSMIDGLQSELATKQRKVADCETVLAKVSKKAQEALDRAKEELDQYKAKIAEALGLPTLKNHSDRLRATGWLPTEWGTGSPSRTRPGTSTGCIGS
jgi:vacuolar-type H+-ATPase subunit I/STV1